MLTAVGVAAAASRTDASTSGSTSIRGVVRDGDQPLAHIEVRANPQGPGAISVTRTDERGGYAFEGLKPGSYVISFGGFSVPHEPAHGSWDADVEVCKGTTLVLESSSPPDVMGEVVVEVQPPDVIAGRVTSQKHADGLSGAIVTLLRPSDGFRRTARTDAYGRYRIAELEPGHYILTGEAQGFLTRSTGLDLNGQPTEQFFAPGSASERVGDIALCPYRVAR
jgi:hypothetical protein